MRARTWARLPFVAAVLLCGLLVGLPLLAMVVESILTPDGVSFSAWRQLLSSPTDRSQLLNSIELGLLATAIALALGGGHAWLTEHTDLPAATVLGPLGVAPLAMPPILVAMGFADVADVAGFGACAFLLGVSYAPFVAVLTARGMRAIDGRSHEAALVSRGRFAAERLLARMVSPEVAAGCLLVFVFVISEHGVPEFLTVKGKTWHTYAEGVFARWTRRATGVAHSDLVGPVVAALPLVLASGIALALVLRLRARSTVGGDFRPLPVRRLGRWRWPALALPLFYLGAGVGLPVAVMMRWAAGSTVVSEPMSLATLRTSFQSAIAEAGGDLVYTTAIAAATVVLLLLIATPLAVRGRRTIEGLSVLPVAVPAVLLAIGFIKVFNNPTVARLYGLTGDFYDSPAIVVAAYAARFLPFAVLTLAHANRRIDPTLDEAGRLARASPVARSLGIRLPLLAPAMWSAACLVFVLALRELDVAVVLPAGNGTVVRRLSNIVHFGGENTGGALALLLLLIAALPPLLTVITSGRRLRSLS